MTQHKGPPCWVKGEKESLTLTRNNIREARGSHILNIVQTERHQIITAVCQSHMTGYTYAINILRDAQTSTRIWHKTHFPQVFNN